MSSRRKIDRENYFETAAVTPAPLPEGFANQLVPAQMDAVGYGGQSLPVVQRTDGTVQIGGFLLSGTGLTVQTEVNREEWEVFYQVIQRTRQALQWIIGDWMIYGAERGWFDNYRAMAKQTGLKENTIKDYTYICRNIPASIRIDKLKFAHFQLIAPLPDEDKPKWIKLAVDKKMSVRQLYNAIHRRTDPPPPLDKNERRLLKIVSRHLRTNTLHEISGDDAVILPKLFEHILHLVKSSKK